MPPEDYYLALLEGGHRNLINHYFSPKSQKRLNLIMKIFDVELLTFITSPVIRDVDTGRFDPMSRQKFIIRFINNDKYFYIFVDYYSDSINDAFKNLINGIKEIRQKMLLPATGRSMYNFKAPDRWYSEQ